MATAWLKRSDPKPTPKGAPGRVEVRRGRKLIVDEESDSISAMRWALEPGDQLQFLPQHGSATVTRSRPKAKRETREGPKP